ncbi:MAG: glycosyltransferase family 2 protein [Mucilaginibacter sp.]|uniref:glycosyltransferase family 2 protein n=1 Tax=Mucilaginibacter sp. TaxID=1882438 RepID=UPI0034E46748
MPKKVALILLNWNTPIHTANCIKSLKQYCNEQLFDIIVADNGSTDGSLALLQNQFPGLVYINNERNLGFAEGNNRALVYSIEKGYTYSLVINTDTLVDEDIVLALSTHLDNYPQAAIVQPAIYWMHDKTRIWNGRGCFNQLSGLIYSEKKCPSPVNGLDSFEIAKWATGCCMLLRNAALINNGLFNKQFYLYYEDVELSFRMRGNGYELHYLPSSKMYHEAGASAKVEKKEGVLSPVIHYYISRNRLWFLRRYGNPVYYPVYIFGGFLYYASLWIYFKLRGRNQKATFLIKGLRDGIFTPNQHIWN